MCKEEPSPSALRDLLGVSLFEVWHGFRSAIEAAYEMEQIGGPGGKNWRYEYKYRRGGKTLCCLYARENGFGFLVIFGQAERAAFEEMRCSLPAPPAGNTTRRRPIAMENGSCLRRRIWGIWTPI